MFTISKNLKVSFLTLFVLLLTASFSPQFVWGQAVNIINSAGDTLMHVQEAGNIGIGLTSPAQKLHVNGNANVRGLGVGTAGFNGFYADIEVTNLFGTDDAAIAIFSSTGRRLVLKGGFDATISQPINGGINFNTGAEETRLSITQNGNIGIGTVIPNGLLTVHNGGSNAAFMGLTLNNGTVSARFEFVSPGSAHLAIPADLIISPGNSEKARFTADGELGMGTTTPIAKLHVVDGTIFIDAETTGTDGLAVQNAAGNVFWINSPASNRLDIGGRGNLDSPPTSGAISILDNDNVGIGTTLPVAKLHVVDGTIFIRAETTGTDGLAVQNAAGNVFWINSPASNRLDIGGRGNVGTPPTSGAISILDNDNVGIGTTSPTSTLDIDGTLRTTGNALFQGDFVDHFKPGGSRVILRAATINPTVELRPRGAGTQGFIQFYNPAGAVVHAIQGSVTLGLFIKSTGGLPIVWSPGASEAMRATASGNVGIGTPTPGSKLHVGANGANPAIHVDGPARTYGLGINASKFSIYDITGGTVERLTVDQGGNVGIGTTSPDQLLSVNGNASKVGGGSWATFSDARLKEIQGTYDAGLEEILSLQPIRYRYKEDNPMGIPDQGEHVGFSAQEVQRVIPDAVSENSRGYLMVENDPILWAMLNAIKEQQKTITELKEAIQKQDVETRALKTELTEFASLKAEVARLALTISKSRSTMKGSPEFQGEATGR